MSTRAVEGIWWEKTVEYLFARTVLPQTAMAVPLAGAAEERFGDLIDGDQAAFRLIEFKRDRSTLNTELEKYAALGKPKSGQYFADYLHQKSPELFEQPGAAGHWLVYGELKARGGSELGLVARQYAAEELVPGRFIHADAHLPRVSANSLWWYMARLALLRGKTKWEGSSGGLVVATFEDSTIVQTPDEFISNAVRLSRRLQNEMKQHQALSQQQQDPGPPRRQREYEMERGR